MARVRSDSRELIDAYTKKQVLAECGHRCAHCGKQLTFGKTFTLDHAVPLDKGGTNDMNNFVALCYDCNQAKSNLVVHTEQYYAYLPEPKRKAVLTYVERFMQKHDWLQFNNLFKYDWFQAPYRRNILTGKGTKILHISRRCLVRKLAPEETVDMLNAYKTAIDPAYWDRLMSDPESVAENGVPFYSVTDIDDNAHLMCFSVYINPERYVSKATGEERKANAVIIDLFHNPKAGYSRIKSSYDVMAVVELIFNQIQHSFGCKSPKSTVMGMLRCLNGDPYMTAVFQELARTAYFNMTVASPEEIAQYGLDPDTTTLDFVLFQGSHRDLKDVTDGEMALSFDKILMKQDDIDRRLIDSKTTLDQARKQRDMELSLDAKLKKLRQSTEKPKRRRR